MVVFSVIMLRKSFFFQQWLGCGAARREQSERDKIDSEGQMEENRAGERRAGWQER